MFTKAIEVFITAQGTCETEGIVGEGETLQVGLKYCKSLCITGRGIPGFIACRDNPGVVGECTFFLIDKLKG